MDKNHIVMAMDSCRYDSLVSAEQGGLPGEDCGFGHGPAMHGKCFGIRAVEGRLSKTAAVA